MGLALARHLVKNDRGIFRLAHPHSKLGGSPPPLLRHHRTASLRRRGFQDFHDPERRLTCCDQGCICCRPCCCCFSSNNCLGCTGRSFFFVVDLISSHCREKGTFARIFAPFTPSDVGTSSIVSQGPFFGSARPSSLRFKRSHKHDALSRLLID